MGSPAPNHDASLFSQVFITAELTRRAPRRTDYLREKVALQDLAALMVDGPGQVLPRFVELAMQMTGGVSAGLSLLEPEPAPGFFRWHHVCGTLQVFEGATTPRNDSPCGVTLDQAQPVLTRHSERLYKWIADAGIVVPEVLLVPLFRGGPDPIGTLWIVSDEEEHFDSGDARVAGELATFVGIALRMQRAEEELRATLAAKDELIDRLKQAEAQQNLFAHELQHRMANTLAMVSAIASQIFRTSDNKDEAQVRLHARLRALSEANAILVRSNWASASMADVVEGALAPHRSGEGRIHIAGPDVDLPSRQSIALALALHELATNATKYGSLSAPGGKVDVAWRVVPEQEGSMLVFQWQESGGPEVLPPSRRGFGSRLIEGMLGADFSGKVTIDFAPDGLVCRFSAPLQAIRGDGAQQPTN